MLYLSLSLIIIRFHNTIVMYACINLNSSRCTYLQFNIKEVVSHVTCLFSARLECGTGTDLLTVNLMQMLSLPYLFLLIGS